MTTRCINSRLLSLSPTGCSEDSWRDTFFGKHEHGALWLLICGAAEKHLLTYLLTYLHRPTDLQTRHIGNIRSHLMLCIAMRPINVVFVLWHVVSIRRKLCWWYSEASICWARQQQQQPPPQPPHPARHQQVRRARRWTTAPSWCARRPPGCSSCRSSGSRTCRRSSRCRGPTRHVHRWRCSLNMWSRAYVPPPVYPSLCPSDVCLSHTGASILGGNDARCVVKISGEGENIAWNSV